LSETAIAICSKFIALKVREFIEINGKNNKKFMVDEFCDNHFDFIGVS
jgi:hypothetical protein